MTPEIQAQTLITLLVGDDEANRDWAREQLIGLCRLNEEVLENQKPRPDLELEYEVEG
jgi:hypothetical protein